MRRWRRLPWWGSREDTGQAIVAFVTLGGGREGDDATVAALNDHVATDRQVLPAQAHHLGR